MARVQSTLVLNDQMTRVLSRVNKAIGLTLDSLEAVQRATGRSFKSAPIRAARQEIGAANAALNEMEQSYRACNSQQEQLNQRIRQGANSTNGLLGKIKGLASAYVGMKAVGKVVGLSDTMTQTNARLSMMNDGKQNTADLKSMIYASAQRSRGSYLATADAVAKMGLMAGDAFSSNKETVAFMEQVNKQFKIAGTSAQGIDAAMLQLTQAMGSGVLRGEEYNSILEQAPNIIQSIAKYLDVPKGKLKDMAAQGKITADIVKAAMFACADETNTKFESMPKTWGDIWTSIQSRAIKALDPLLVKINQLANSSSVQQTVDGLMNAFSTAAVVLAQVFEGVCAVYNFVVGNWSWIAPIVYGIAAAFAAYNAVLLVHKGILAAQAAIKAVQTVREYAQAKAILSQAAAHGINAKAVIAEAAAHGTNAAALTGEAATAGLAAAGLTAQQVATAGATVAQAGLNTAIWACPITWVIAGILLLIVLVAVFFEQVVGAIYWLGALFKNIGLWIANLGLAAWAIIQNIGLWFKNLFHGIVNVVKACANNVSTAFHNAWIFVQQGFWYMVNTVMQGLKSLANMANKVLGWMGVNIDTSGLDFAAKKIEDLNSKKESYVSVGDAWRDGYNTFSYNSVSDAFGTNNAFQKGWSSSAYNAGAAAGRGIKSSVTEMFGGIFGSDAAGFGGADPLSDIVKNTGVTAANTGKSTEELSYLRDIAERDAINRFTTAEIKVDLGGVTNNVAANTDLDGIISYLTDGIAEALVTASEGVY